MNLLGFGTHQISSSYAFVLNFSVISSMKMLYLHEKCVIAIKIVFVAHMVESMFRDTRKIMNQSPVEALVTRW